MPSIYHPARLVVVLATVGALLGCASVEPPTETISAADLAVSEVNRADEREHARLEIHVATQELQAARDALKQEDNLMARRHAERALAQAQLAEAKIQSSRAEANVTQLRDDINALRLEIERASNRGRAPAQR